MAATFFVWAAPLGANAWMLVMLPVSQTIGPLLAVVISFVAMVVAIACALNPQGKRMFWLGAIWAGFGTAFPVFLAFALGAALARMH